MFSQLRQGSAVYVMEKTTEGLVLRIGQITKEGKQVSKYPQMGYPQEMEIDYIELKAGDQSYKFEHLPPMKNLERYGNVIVSDSSDAILQEAENARAESKQALDMTDYNKKVVASSEQIKRQLNPSYEKEQKRDDAIDTLSKKFDAIEAALNKLIAAK